jgi:hypothetical protein
MDLVSELMQITIQEDVAPSYFRLMFNTSSKRAFNSTRAKRDRLTSNKQSLQILALNEKQLKDNLTTLFPGRYPTFFQDEQMCADMGYSGVSLGGLMEAYSNWGEQGGRLQAVGFKVVSGVLILHVRVQTNLVRAETYVIDDGGEGSIENSAQTGASGPVSRNGEALRSSYSRVAGLWPRESTGLPKPWSETPSWIKLMIISAYKTELNKRKLTLGESAENDLQK